MPRTIGTAGKPLTTKCEVLKDASKVFDPFGIVRPVSVCAKLFMQKLWQFQVEWDEPLDAALRDEWTATLTDIQHLSGLAIHQRFFQTSFLTADITLHVFADASTRAYGTVVFFTSGSEVTFVMAKNCYYP